MNQSEIKKIPAVMEEVSRVIFGKADVIQMTVVALLAGGHVLFEDVPGVGKTLMIKALAKAIHSDFARIQFTPDLMANDVLGVSVYHKKSERFEFIKGPIFSSVLLADEINRATPRAQAALLEAMSEKQVTIDNQTYPLSPNFFVLATQNPLEYEGTYPLPEAQLDRFLFRLKIGYPSYQDELRLLENKTEEALNRVATILTPDALLDLKKNVAEIHVEEKVLRYALDLVVASRQHPAVKVGVSPRGGVAFVTAAKAFALTEGRSFVTPGDFKKILTATFGHRLQLQPAAQQSLSEILEELIDSVAVPIRS